MDQSLPEFGSETILWTIVSQNLVQKQFCGPKSPKVWSRNNFVDHSLPEFGPETILSRPFHIQLFSNQKHQLISKLHNLKINWCFYTLRSLFGLLHFRALSLINCPLQLVIARCDTDGSGRITDHIGNCAKHANKPINACKQANASNRHS